MKTLRMARLTLVATVCLMLGLGCASTRIDWDARVGNYHYDDAIRELGPPDRHATLTDGSLVADWVTNRGARTATTFGGGFYPYHYGWLGPSYVVVDPPAPDRLLRLTFDPQGMLVAWERTYR
jgi:hypothetical protein